MLQEKFVGYLDYREEDKGKRCVGYLRGELYEAACNIEICVQKMHETDSFCREVIMHGFDENDNAMEFSIGEVWLSYGQASVCFQGLDRNNLLGSRMTWERLWKICIPIGSGSEIECEIHKNLYRIADVRANEGKQDEEGTIQESLDSKEEKEKQELQREREQQVLKERKENREKDIIEEKKEKRENKEAVYEQMNGQEQVLEAAEMTENVGDKKLGKEASVVEQFDELSIEKQGQQREERDESIRIPRMQEEKWAQLSGIYPKVNPFKDHRTYLKLGLQDFVILPEKYYIMCKNSFLLHGYMNYGYLVLGMFVKRGNYEYYLGVPGVFYEKERQVAKLYGFDYFEADRELARDGDFGIYLMKIAL